jgi:hypothetical protein
MWGLQSDRVGLTLARRSGRGEVSAMKHRALIVTGVENVWWVRLDGVDVVSFSGPHARQWACREREELAQLLEAQADTDLDEPQHASVSHAQLSWMHGTKVQTL